MEYGICLLSVVPVRSEPSDKSEMVTQLLFGEVYRVEESASGWYRVILEYDGYPGWINAKQGTSIPEQMYNSVVSSRWKVTTGLVTDLFDQDNNAVHLVPGSTIPFSGVNSVRILNKTFTISGSLPEPGEIPSSGSIIHYAMLFLNAPYLWGGRTPFGVDCSGFSQIVYKMAGVRLKRDAHQQAGQGTIVNFLSEGKPGDLLFFHDQEEKIIHTGILTDPTHVIHASGRVRIDPVDHFGIFDPELQQYTHRLRLVKKFF
jgi:hypothetical protein